MTVKASVRSHYFVCGQQKAIAHLFKIEIDESSAIAIVWSASAIMRSPVGDKLKR
ncbi:hypothetical protein [Tolypothrix sp. NIES-4075]|uniref:hypothetical protein n=1 Tax=Tolypothrix sp. NIES-4075 TaxID=2005459 RepID=UPI0013590DDB|nr:hypothetical protein [Tolypothrix sp. NIES-4075]